jgi:glutamyl-tRNA synthetase
MSEIRTRFAPSPTGHLHIGSARTALYNWLVARRAGGVFVLRIEDTDLERSTQESVDSILEAMHWMGMDWDEGPGVEGPFGPYFQTQRLEIYKQHIEKLLAEGKAYRCYATKEELDEMRERAKEQKINFPYDRRWRDKGPEDWPTDRPYAVRLKAPLEGEIIVEDAIVGTVRFNIADHVDDYIIARSDGMPTYNFTVVVDDVTMNITQVIRGDDHLNNTPKQILLYDAFGYPRPLFAHMPLTLGKDRTRLSKRHGATSVLAYRDMGFLPEALVNYLVRLGWSHGDQEIFSTEELIQYFSIDDVSSSSGIFDQDKLNWINQQYIQNADPATIAAQTLPFLQKVGVETEVDERLIAIVKQLNVRAVTLVELAEKARMFYQDEFAFDEKADAKFMIAENLPLLETIAAGLTDLSAWTHDDIQAVFEAAMAQYDLKMGKVAQPVRVALTGNTVSPSIYETVELIGRDSTLLRLNRALERIRAKG